MIHTSRKALRLVLGREVVLTTRGECKEPHRPMNMVLRGLVMENTHMKY